MRIKSSRKEVQVLAVGGWTDVYLGARSTSSDTYHSQSHSVAENWPYGFTWMQRRLGYIAPNSGTIFPWQLDIMGNEE